MDVVERWTSTVVLGDGTSALIRPITPADAGALAVFHERQSADSRYMRYFTPKPTLSDEELARFTTVDFRDRAAFVVEEHGEFVAWASYERWKNRDDAEVAFMVDDHHHGQGIATLMLEYLAAVAKENGIVRFTAQTLGSNHSMLRVFARAGWPLQRRFESGVIDIDFAIAATPTFADSVERREQRADSRAMARLLLASSIAVIGASDIDGTIGHALWERISASPRRRVWAVNPNRSTVGDAIAYSRIGDVPDDVGLAVIAVPATVLAATINECVEARVRGAIVVTSVDDDPDIDMPAIVAHARHNGLRIIGPSSVGVASPLPEVALQASLADIPVPAGNVAFSIQSGTLGSAVVRLAAQLRMPTSWFVSLGDKSDVSGNDLLQFWEDDEATSVIAIYTESLGNPRKFARIARRVSRTRPIVSVRTGSALSGTGTDALYANTGVIQVPTVTALLDTARTLATQPLMQGQRVAVVSNSASPTVLATASLQSVGLDVVPPPQALTWRSSSDDYASAVAAALDDDGIDAVMVIHAPPLIEAVGEPTEAIDAASRDSNKPIVAVMLGAGNGPLQPGSDVPSFAFPEQAAFVLGRIARYSAWRRAEPGQSPEGESESLPNLADPIAVERAAALLERQLGDEHADATPTPELIQDLLECYGVTMAAGRLVPAGIAIEVAEGVGYPVAIKAEHRRVGRTVAAGVALDLLDAADVEAAISAMRAQLGDDAGRVYVQRMAPPGFDVRVSVRQDPRVGPVVGVGIGGLQAAAIDHEAVRLAPVSPSMAAAMVAESSAAGALDHDASEQLAVVIARVAQLASDHPVIAELDLNPVIVSADGCWVVDAQLRLSPTEGRDRGVRRLDEQ